MCVPVLHVLVRSGGEFNMNTTRGIIPLVVYVVLMNEKFLKIHI